MMRTTGDRAVRGVLAAVAACAICVSGGSAGADGVDYILDDGSGGFNLGPSVFDAWMTWGNVFDSVPKGRVINEVLVSFPTSLGAGVPLWVGVYNLPEGSLDPRDATLLSLTEGVSAATGPQDFGTYQIAPTEVSGSFLVSVTIDAAQGQAVARMDQDTPGVRSWMFWNDVFDTDLSDQELTYHMIQTPFAGTWMVRARGIPAPGAGFVLALAGVAACRRRR